MSDRGVVFVIRDERYGSAIMRGIQQVETMCGLGLPVRLLSVRADEENIRRLEDQTVVLVKDAAVENELVMALATAGNQVVWDVVDFFAHKPPLGGVVTMAEFLKSMAISVCVDHALVMTNSCGEFLTREIPSLNKVTFVDHQVDRSLLDAEPAPPPEAFGVAYLGAVENIPGWVPDIPALSYLLTSKESFSALTTSARAVPFQVDFRNPLRDRRALKPWTKAATAFHLGAVVIAEETEANSNALGPDYPLFFDGTRRGFIDAVATAEDLWGNGEWAAIRTSATGAIERSDPRFVARRLADVLGMGAPT